MEHNLKAKSGTPHLPGHANYEYHLMVVLASLAKDVFSEISLKSYMSDGTYQVLWVI